MAVVPGQAFVEKFQAFLQAHGYRRYGHRNTMPVRLLLLPMITEEEILNPIFSEQKILEIHGQECLMEII